MITKEDLTKRIAAAMVARDSLRKTASKNVAAAMKNNALLAFQKADGTLSADGLYGPNSKVALAWYLQNTKDNVVPEVNPKLTKTSKGAPITITWKAPELAKAPAPVIAKAPAPAPAKASSGSGSLFGGFSDSVGELRKKAAALQAKAPVVAKAQAQVKAKAKKKVKKIAKAIGPLPAFGQELLAQNIGKVDAEDVISAVAAGAPIVSNVLKSMDAESNIANEFAKIQGKGLKGIKKTLLRGALQKDATSEHRSLTKRDNFRRTVLTELKNIKSQLAAKKAGKGGDDYRIVGLLL
jgi:hypothetical protein